MQPRTTTRIREIRKMQRLTLKELADKMKTTPQTIQRLETDNMTLSMEWLDKFALALGVPRVDLLVERPQSTPEDAMIEMLRNELIRTRREAPGRSVLAAMEANGRFATMLIEGEAGLRPWRDVRHAAAAAAACAIRIALDGEPGQVAVAPPLALVSKREAS